VPFIQVDAGPITKEKKTELIKALTDAASSILDIPTEAFSVIIRENNPDNIGVGGIPLAEKLKK
jgi:4-oxalocrotonate tautomerase